MKLLPAIEKKLYSPGKRGAAFRVFVSFLMVIPIIGLVFFSSWTIYSDMTEDVYSRSQDRISLVENLVHERINSLIVLTESIASRPKVVEYVKSGLWTEAMRYAEYIPEQYGYIDSMRLVDLDGTIKAGAGSFSDLIGENLAAKDWYRGVSSGWEPYISDIFKRLSSPRINVAAIAVPVKELPLPGVELSAGDGPVGKVIGILTIQVRPEVFREWLEETPMGEDAVKYLVDKNGNLIAHSQIDTTDRMVDFSSAPAVRRLLRGETGTDKVKDITGRHDMLASYMSCVEHDWGLVIEQPISSAFELRNENMLNQIPIYISFIILSFIAALLILRHIASGREDWENIQRLAMIVENTADAIYSRDLDDNIITWNKGAEKIYGYSADEIMGKPFSIMVPEKQRRKYARMLENIRKGQSIKDRIVQRVKKNRSRIYVSLTSSLVRNYIGEIIGISSIARNITAQIESERRMKEKSRQLEQLNKELESFSYSVSHDLRGPLRGIDGFSSVLAEEYSDRLDGQARDYIGRIKKAAQRMGDIIEDLIMLSRITRDEMNLKKVNLSRMAEKFCKNLKDEHGIGSNESRAGTEYVIRPGISVYADEHLMEVMLSNLLENAFKFSLKKPRPIVEFGKKVINEKKVIFVRDNGSGFDMKYAERVFEPFQRLHSSKEFPGTGIGMATVKRIVERHNGKIWIESEKNRGTTVYFVISGKGGN